MGRRDEISVREAAIRLGVTLAYVYSLLWAGKLKGRKVNDEWRVSAVAVSERIEARVK